MSRRARAGALSTLAFASGALACQALAGLDEPHGSETDGAAPRSDPCIHARPPVRAGSSTPNAEERVDHWFVMGPITFPLDGDAGAPHGFDLDEACTCAPDLHDGGAPCEPPSGKASCDEPSGIDNTFAHADDPSGVLHGVAMQTNAAIALGSAGALLYLGGYNGEPDDGEVTVAIVPSDGLFSTLGCDERPRGSVVADGGTLGPRVPPANDGCDHWKIREGFSARLGQTMRPLVGIGAGYVTGSRLVARLPSIWMPFSGRALSAGEGTFTARIEPITVAGARAYRLVDGVAAARTPLLDLVGLLGLARSGASDQALCSSTSWGAVTRALCESLDTMTSSATDFGQQTCNAFSLTWGFDAQPVRIDELPRNAAPDVPSPTCESITTPAQLCRPR